MEYETVGNTTVFTDNFILYMFEELLNESNAFDEAMDDRNVNAVSMNRYHVPI